MDRVCDAMTRNPITVSAATTNREAIRLLLEKNISGLFVVDGENRLTGIGNLDQVNLGTRKRLICSKLSGGRLYFLVKLNQLTEFVMNDAKCVIL